LGSVCKSAKTIEDIVPSAYVYVNSIGEIMALCQPDPILRFVSADGKIVDILSPGSGWKLADPYWNPQIAQYKSGGFKVNPSIAPGQRLVSKQYDNVIETFPLIANGFDQEACIATINELLALSRQSADYWAESYEFDDVWLEAKPAGVNSLIGYAQISQMRIPELTNPFGQPFFSIYKEAVMEGLSIIVEREPLWRSVAPGEIIGPLYNLIKNPDFELWSTGIADSQPDSWTDLETIQITGENSRQDEAVHSGNYALRIHVGGSTNAGRIKGVSQVIANTKDNTTYTVVAWVRSSGVSNGVGRILVTYSSQLEVYRESVQHGWTLYTGVFITGFGDDTVAINCEILTTAAGTDGNVYFDSLMLIEGDWQQEAVDGVLPYLSGSHIANHWDQDSAIVEAGDINYVDVWDVPGNDDALVRLNIINITPTTDFSNPAQVIAELRAGMRRAGEIFNFQNYQDPVGPNDTTASGDNRITSDNLSATVWATIATFIIGTPATTLDNSGRFRAFARVFDSRTGGTPTLQVRLRYWIGAANRSVKTLNTVNVPIINNWCIVDLTPDSAINWDVRKDASAPTDFGFDIQMRRTANTDPAYLDYVLLLPSDGGIAIAEVDPAILQSQALTIDCTISAPSIIGSDVITDWNKVSETTPAATAFQHVRMIDYAGALYIQTSLSVVYKYQNRIMTIDNASYSNAFEVYNGFLFTVEATPATGFSTDGTLPVGSGGTARFTYSPSINIRAMRALGGNLYFGGTDGSLGHLFSWNGIAATATHIFSDATITEIAGIAAYQNTLFIIGLQAGSYRVFKYNLSNNTITLSLTLGGGATTPFNFATFLGELWLTANTSSVNHFNGSSWTTVTSPSGVLGSCFGLKVIDDTLFICGTNLTATRGTVAKTTDGTNFEVDFLDSASVMRSGRILEKSQGQLFMGTDTTGLSLPAPLFAKTIEANEFKVSNYQLVPFVSPPKKRHRFFFNWDRKADVNNVDDAALVGIGFIPRYLTLRGRG